MKHLLIVFHSKTGNTKRLIDAVLAGAQDPELDPVEVRCLRAADATDADLLWAHGLVLGTPENFGYMSGALKDFLDRTYYEVENKLLPLPYTLVISAGNDGTGAVRAIERIANGYPLVRVQEPIIARGEITKTELARCRDLGMTMAAGLSLGMF